MKSRRHVYLDDSLMKRLDRLTAAPGTSPSAVIAAALSAYLENMGADTLDEKLKVRLERSAAQLSRIERDVGIVMESLAVFVRYQLAVTAPLPAADLVAGRKAAEDRFQAFLDSVGRRRANGKCFRNELSAHLLQREAADAR